MYILVFILSILILSIKKGGEGGAGALLIRQNLLSVMKSICWQSLNLHIILNLCNPHICYCNVCECSKTIYIYIYIYIYILNRCRVSHRCWEHGRGLQSLMWGLKSIQWGSMGGALNAVEKTLQACKFSKNELLHTYFWRILARF